MERERREEGALLILRGRVSTYVPRDSSKRSRPLLSTPLPASTRPPARILKDSTSTRLISVRGEAMVAIGENEIRGSMHSGWNQSSRMFLRGYTTHINRLPTLRSSISITKVAIVLMVPFLLFFILRKYISAAIQSTLISNRSLSLLCIQWIRIEAIVSIMPIRRQIDTKLRSDITPRLLFLFFFIFPSFLLFFLFYFSRFFSLFFQIPCRYRGGIRVIYMEKVDGGSWIRAKFVRFCSDFMNVSRRALPRSR